MSESELSNAILTYLHTLTSGLRRHFDRSGAFGSAPAHRSTFKCSRAPPKSLTEVQARFKRDNFWFTSVLIGKTLGGFCRFVLVEFTCTSFDAQILQLFRKQIFFDSLFSIKNSWMVVLSLVNDYL